MERGRNRWDLRALGVDKRKAGRKERREVRTDARKDIRKVGVATRGQPNSRAFKAAAKANKLKAEEEQGREREEGEVTGAETVVATSGAKKDTRWGITPGVTSAAC